MQLPQPDDDFKSGSVSSPGLIEFLDRMLEAEMILPIHRRFIPTLLPVFAGLRGAPLVMTELMNAYGALINLGSRPDNFESALECARMELPSEQLETVISFAERLRRFMNEDGIRWLILCTITIAASRLSPTFVRAHTDTRKLEPVPPVEH